MAPRMKNMGPGCCCDGDCIIFADMFEGDELGSHWNVISGSMVFDATNDLATIASGSVIGPTVNQPTGSGSFFIDILGDIRETLTIRFAYADANNHWRVDLDRATVDSGSVTAGRPIIYDSWRMKFYETVGGSTEYIGSRHIIFPHIFNPLPPPAPAVIIDDETDRQSFHFCWHEGGRVTVEVSNVDLAGDYNLITDPYVLTWPNSVVGGNSFRIEPDYDMEIHEGDWRYHLIEHEDLGAYVVLSNPGGCPCEIYNCIQCAGEWGDTMQIEFTSGPYTGDGVVVNRHRDFPTTDDGRHYGYPLNYWQFYYVAEFDFFGPADPDGEDWHTSLYFCEATNSPYDGRLFMQHIGSYPSAEGDDDFDISDCVGPFTATMDIQDDGTATVEITPNAP